LPLESALEENFAFIGRRRLSDCGDDRHVERVDDELFAHVVRHRPSNHATTAAIEYHGQEKETRICRYVRDIRNPKSIGERSDEVALDKIASGNCFSIAASGCDPLAPRSSVAITLPSEN